MYIYVYIYIFMYIYSLTYSSALLAAYPVQCQQSLIYTYTKKPYVLLKETCSLTYSRALLAAYRALLASYKSLLATHRAIFVETFQFTQTQWRAAWLILRAYVCVCVCVWVCVYVCTCKALSTLYRARLAAYRALLSSHRALCVGLFQLTQTQWRAAWLVLRALVKFSKVSSPLNLLGKIAVKLTFQNVFACNFGRLLWEPWDPLIHSFFLCL